jgi:hypothetical protein
MSNTYSTKTKQSNKHNTNEQHVLHKNQPKQKKQHK